jgi:hypothetical protein
MRLGWLNFLIDRHEGFHKAIRIKKIFVDRKEVSKYYSILFFGLGIYLLIVAIIGFLLPEILTLISILIIVALEMGITGIIYLNVSKRFIKSPETN